MVFAQGGARKPVANVLRGVWLDLPATKTVTVLAHADEGERDVIPVPHR
ncbi:hypothetical protein [Mycobacterium sp.]|nr:hypothetical protein [Mycobacterium sp.]